MPVPVRKKSIQIIVNDDPFAMTNRNDGLENVSIDLSEGAMQ
jgi:hypothetical protein